VCSGATYMSMRGFGSLHPPLRCLRRATDAVRLPIHLVSEINSVRLLRRRCMPYVTSEVHHTRSRVASLPSAHTPILKDRGPVIPQHLHGSSTLRALQYHRL
jgi:hypothetical protein